MVRIAFEDLGSSGQVNDEREEDDEVSVGDSGANEKENVVGIWLFKTCWGKRYVAEVAGGGAPPLPTPSVDHCVDEGPCHASDVARFGTK